MHWKQSLSQLFPMRWDLMNIYPNVLTWSTSTLHRHLVHSPTKGHRCDSWTKVFLISLSGTRKMPRRESILNTSSCGLNSSQSKCHSLVVIRICPNRMSYNNNNETVHFLSLCTLWLLQASRDDLGQEQWGYKWAGSDFP